MRAFLNAALCLTLSGRFTQTCITSLRWMISCFIIALTLSNHAIAQQFRTMPLGDEFTKGVNSSGGSGYRWFLNEFLSSAGFTNNFVGSLKNGSDLLDNDHEGHEGFTATAIADNVATYLGNNSAQIVLLMAGHHDITAGRTTQDITSDLGRALDAIIGVDNAIEVYVAALPPRLDGKQADVDALNTNIRNLVAAKADAGNKVYLVDLAVEFAADPRGIDQLLFNNLSPNDRGYEVMGASWFSAIAANHEPLITEFSDDFNRPGPDLGNDWDAPGTMQIAGNQLVNTATGIDNDRWDKFIAIVTRVINPVEIEFSFGTNSDATGRAFTGAAVMLDQLNNKKANGYLIVHNSSQLRLFELRGSAPFGAAIDVITAERPDPQIGDVLRVEMQSTASGHTFNVFINGQPDGTLIDPARRQGNASTLYAGVQIHGNTNNGVDNVLVKAAVDDEPPAAIADLSVTSSSATSVSLQFTAPGDDGNTGVAAAYDLRYSTSNLDANNFQQATRVNLATPPKPAGSTESLQVSGLEGGNVYYFAIRSVDDFGNISDLSNVVEAQTKLFKIYTDDFERPGPALGGDWVTAAGISIANGTVQNTGTDWRLAVFKPRKSPQEVSMIWSPNGTTEGTRSSGLFVMGSDTSATASGYLIHHDNNSGQTNLWHIVEGQVIEIIDGGSSLSGIASPGSNMTAQFNITDEFNAFNVFIDGRLDRELADVSKRETGTYTGMMLDALPNAQDNAIEEFSLAAPIKPPALLKPLSGNNQVAVVGSPLPEPLVVQLTDDDGNAVPGKSIDFKLISGEAQIVPPKIDENLRLEAESGVVQPPLETRDDPQAAGGKYVVYPNSASADASLTLTFDLDNTGTYYLWTRSRKDPPDDGRWQVVIDGGTPFTYNVFQGGTSSEWAWDPILNPQGGARAFTLTAGKHTMVFRALRKETGFDKLLISPSQDYEPGGKEEIAFLTDADGKASARVTLGGTAGEITIHAAFGSLPAAVFTAIANGDVASQITSISGNNQTGTAGKPLAEDFKVKVSDVNNNFVAGHRVTWLVTTGDGRLSQYSSVTDANGLAVTRLTLGSLSTTYKVEAQSFSPAGGVLGGSPVIFNATADPNTVASKAELRSGNGQQARVKTALPNPLVVRIVNASGQPVSNFPVEFAVRRGGGTLTSNSKLLNAGFEITEANGTPTEWQLQNNATPEEVKSSALNPRSGNRSLEINSQRDGVGVSQAFDYAENTSYVLTFFARVVSGTAVIDWRYNDAGGNLVTDIYELTPPQNTSVWHKYTLGLSNGQAGRRIMMFRLKGSGQFFVDDVNISAATNSAGQLSTVWTLGDTAGTQEVQALALAGSSNLPNSPVIFQAEAVAGVAALLSEVSGNDQIGSASQPLSAPFVVRVTDDTNINPVAGYDVTFKVTQGSGRLAGNVSTKTVQTNASGLASALYTLGPEVNASNVVEASGAGLQGSPIQFRASTAVPALFQISGGSNQRGSAGYPLAEPLTAKLTDVTGNPISGFPVVFEVITGGGTINGKAIDTVMTDTNGEASGTLVCGPKPETLNRVRTSSTLQGSNLTGSPRDFKIFSYGLRRIKIESGNQQEGTVGTFLPEPLAVTVVDTGGNGIAGQSIKFEVIKGEGSLEGGVTSKSIDTGKLGIASVRYKLGTTPITNQVQAETAAPLDGSPRVFKVEALVGPPDRLSKAAGDSAKGVIGNALGSPFIVLVTDKFQNPVSGTAVTFKVVSGGGTINGAKSVTRVSGDNGQAQAVLTLGTGTGLYQHVVEAEAANGSIPLQNSPARFVATATASTARSMTIDGPYRLEGNAGEQLGEQFRVLVTDLDGSPVANHPVRFKVIRGGGHFANGTADTTVASNSTGIARLLYTLGGLARPDSQIVEASSNDGIDALRNSPLRFVAYARPGAPSSDGSFVAATGGSTPADGNMPLDIVVHVRDAYDNPVSGEAVVLEATNGPNVIDQPAQLTDGNGRAFGQLRSTRAGSKVVTALIPSGIRITRGVTVNFTSLTASRMSLRSGNNQEGNINAAVNDPLAVRVTDRNGNGVSKHLVTYRVASGDGHMFGGGNSVEAVTDDNGVAEGFYVFGPTTGQSQVWAESPGLGGSPVIFIATAVNRTAQRLLEVSGNRQVGIAGRDLPEPIVVKVADSKGAAVAGVTVRFDITFGGGRASAAELLTDVFGRASVNWRLGDRAGLNTLRAVTPENLEGSPLDFSAQAIGGEACCLKLATEVPVGGVVGGQSGGIRVRVCDTNGNGIDGYAVRFDLIKGLSGDALTANEKTSASGGHAEVRLNFGTSSGYRTVRATAPGLSGSPLDIAVFARAAAAMAMQAVERTDNQGGTIGLPLNFPLQVSLLDAHGNPAAGETVSFVVTEGGGHFAGQNNPPNVNAVSDSEGVASAGLTLGPREGLNEARAIKSGLQTGSTIVFKANGFSNNFPIFETVGDQQIYENDRVEFTLRATDADGDPITYEAENESLPPGSVFDASNTQVFTWKPGFNDAGVYQPAFVARDGRGGRDVEIVRIRVLNRNRAPVILERFPEKSPDSRIPDATLPVDSTGVGRLTMWVRAQDYDPEDQLYYQWELNDRPAGGNSDTFEFVSTRMFNTVNCHVSDGKEAVQVMWLIKVPVLLSSFSAATEGSRGVRLEWKTSGETNNVGYNVLRSRSRDGHYAQLNLEIIPPVAGGDYSFIDSRVEAGARYFYKLEDVDASGQRTLHGPLQVDVARPEVFELSQNYPNPFNPATTIQYQLPKAARVELKVFNTLGQIVITLVDARQEAGYHAVLWSGRDQQGNLVPSGVYHYRLEAGEFVVTKKMMLLK